MLVVGGGVAGCEAARVLAERGHKPELFEASDRLGGNLIPGGAPDFKEDDILLAKWYENELNRLNVPVTLNTTVTKEMAADSKYDTVIIATGSRPKMFSLGDDDKVYSAEQVLTGKKVTIVEALSKLMAVNGPICSANKEMLEKLIPYNGIETVCDARVKGYADGKLTADTADGEKVISADSVILSVGYSSVADLYEELQFDVPELYLLGDAKQVANIMYAIWDAFEVANHI